MMFSKHHISKNNRNKLTFLLGLFVTLILFGLFFSQNLQVARANSRSFSNWTPFAIGNCDVTVEGSNLVGSEKPYFSINNYDYPPCPTGITSFFHLNEATSPYFDAFSELQGTCTNCPVSVPGLVGNAQQFDGEYDEVNVAPDASFDWGVDDSFSIEFWVWKNSPCTYNEVMVGRDDGNTSLQMWIGCLGNGMAYFHLKDTSNNGEDVWSTNVLNDGQWHHVAAVRDASTDTNTIYLDGVPKSVTSIYQSGFESATAYLNIGFLNYGVRNRFDGLLDEVVIHNRALTVLEVQDHVNNPESLSFCTTAPSTYLLAVGKVGEGTVTSDPAGITCGTTCSADFDANTVVTLTATPATGWVFSGWSGNCSGMTCEIAMDQVMNVTATFEPAMPIITSSPVTTTEVGVAYSYDVYATGNPAPTYTLISSPAGMTIDPNSGLIEWTPTTIGDYEVTVKAVNSEGSDTQSFTITVFDFPTCPIGITSFFHLDETSSPYLDAFSGLNGACTNCPVSGPGLIGSAQQFDGVNDEVDVAPDASFDWGVDDSFSIEFWVWKNTPCTDNEVIVGRDDGNTSLQMWIGCLGNGMAFFQLSDTTGTKNYVMHTAAINNGQWHHVAAVRDASTDTFYIYLDGVSASTPYVFSAGFDSATAPLNIGFLNYGMRNRFDGLLDEVVIHNRALTALEVQDHVDNPETLSNCKIAPSTYLLTVAKVGEGTVTSDPAGINCNTTCSANFDENKVVTLTATPAAGWAFSGWSGDCSGMTCEVAMDQTRNVTATFSEISPTCYALTLSHTGNGTDPVSTPTNSTDCPTGQYIAGESIILSGASPDTGWEITGWTGTDDDSSTALTNQVIMAGSPHSVSVNYSRIIFEQQVALSTGWNLVSFNLQPTNMGLAAILDSITGSFSLVYAWDASAETWLKYDPSQGFGNTLTELDDTKGFWILITQDTTLTITGTKPTSTGISLLAGWNLVGYPSTVNRDLPGALTDNGIPGGDLNIVMSYQAQDSGDPWKMYDPDLAGTYVNDLITLSPGWGYWVYLENPATWTLDFTLP